MYLGDLPRLVPMIGASSSHVVRKVSSMVFHLLSGVVSENGGQVDAGRVGGCALADVPVEGPGSQVRFASQQFIDGCGEGFGIGQMGFVEWQVGGVGQTAGLFHEDAVKTLRQGVAVFRFGAGCGVLAAEFLHHVTREHVLVFRGTRLMRVLFGGRCKEVVFRDPLVFEGFIRNSDGTLFDVGDFSRGESVGHLDPFDWAAVLLAASLAC
uniref:Uncharacterized protein n=1 Tax=Siphoviridae sp. ctevH2 TaxID=2825593 RepID=A0A8S5UAP7_9CAUD|nr:MAG TPA: hypothetical protein [Siphoviridae sp. ctevH2]